MRSLAALITLACLVANVALAIDNSYFVTKTDRCWVTGLQPKNPFPLEVCFWFNDNSCCNPTTDQKVAGVFDGLIAGPGCAPMGHRVKSTYKEILQFLCMPCDPLEPKYRFRLRDGDTIGQIAADASQPADAFGWKICKSFVQGINNMSGLWGTNGTRYDICGLTLGDSIVTPSVEYADDTDTSVDKQYTAATRFLTAVAGLMWTRPNFTVSIVDDTVANYNFTGSPCYGRRTADRPNGALGAAMMIVLAVATFLATLAF
jgi:hypothetical protein